MESINEYWEERAKEFNKGIPGKSPEVEVILSFVKTLKPKKILEIGVNYGHELKYLEGLAKLYGVDSNETMIENAKQYMPDGIFRLADATSIPYPDNIFDFVYTDGLLSHAPPETVAEALVEAVRVSRNKILLIEYLGTRQSRSGFSNCKKFTWIHNYERLIAPLEVYTKYNERLNFGADIYQVLLLEKRAPQKVTHVLNNFAPSFKGLKIGKFKIGWES